MRPRLQAILDEAGAGILAELVPTYVVMLVVATLLGAWYIVRRAPEAKVERAVLLEVLACAYVGALAGAVLVPGLLAGVDLAAGRAVRFRGLTAYGGLLAGPTVALLMLRFRGLPVRPLLDVAAPAIGLGIFLTRIGCFLAGCDYGRPTDAPWAVQFPAGSYAHHAQVHAGWVDAGAPLSRPVHPTQLYHAIAGLLLAGILVAFGRRLRPGSGRAFAVLIVGYAALRFAVEFLRGDTGRGMWGPLSTSQVISLAVLGCFTLVVAARPKRPATAPG